MSYPLFLAEFANPAPGDLVAVVEEAHHAAVVRRIKVGEVVQLADGAGQAITGEVTVAHKNRLEVLVREVLESTERTHRLVAVQALAKGDRSDLAVELLTELGADEIIAWQAERSIVQWPADRREKALTKWRNVARAAAKQSRRFSVPAVSFATTAQLVNRLGDGTAFVLHEAATQRLATCVLPPAGDLIVVTGPEGGITARELDLFGEHGAQPVLLTDHVLRTSSAGGVALAQLQARFAAR